ncbi:MAG: hypothetical protein JOZ55_04505, partial [Alphaproteobacteria bacterium]|nr:hypothetical protein [Alphaproteobacteria bacterium]
AAQTTLFADVAADIVGEANVQRERSLIMASEDFSFMLAARPGAYINIGNGDTVGSCPVHNPGYDFNDEILPLGAAAGRAAARARFVTRHCRGLGALPPPLRATRFTHRGGSSHA